MAWWYLEEALACPAFAFLHVVPCFFLRPSEMPVEVELSPIHGGPNMLRFCFKKQMPVVG